MKPGIIGPATDPQVASVADCLRRRGADPLILDLSRFPAEPALAWEDGAPKLHNLDVGRVGCWYFRSAPLPLPFFPVEGSTSYRNVEELVAGCRRAYAAGRERRSFLAGFIAELERTSSVFINRTATCAQHFRKLDQLRLLKDACVPVPRTLATNDPDEVRRFYHALAGNVVYKPLAGGGLCRRLLPEDLRDERLALLANAPVLFQQEVPGSNIRAYALGGRIVASYEIIADALDYRGSEASVVLTTLTAEESAACLNGTRACGMTFTGVDVRRRPDGSFAVLECNPSPMFAYIERTEDGSVISDALAEALAG